MKELSEIITTVRQARYEIGLHDLEPEGRNLVIDKMLYQALVKAKELEATLSPRPIEEAPRGEKVLIKSKKIGWIEAQFDEIVWAWETFEGWLDKYDIEGWLPLPSVGGEE